MAAWEPPAGNLAPGRGGRRRGFAAFAVQLVVKAKDWARRDAERLVLWAPVAIGTGAAVYFSLRFEPSLAPGVAILIVAAFFWRFGGQARLFSAAVFFIALGFTAATLRTASVAAPAIDREMTPRQVTGRLLSVDEAPGLRRLIIETYTITGVDSKELPARVRVNWRGEAFHARPGEVVSLRAGLSPRPAPAAPGAFDFSRQLYFEQIGAVGYAVTPPQALEDIHASAGSRLSAAIESVRLALLRRITEKAPGQGGAIVAAVVTGKRAAVNEASQAALRDAGLAHLLAISGLHMGLATGLIFFMARFALAAIEPVALRYPIKKWAAAAALLAGFAYLLLSGGGWSARRAFIMTSIIFIAILVDRRALSLRNVAIAATVILLTTPEAVIHPGFQMSFAAVTALIAAYEWGSARLDSGRSFTWPARLRRYALGLGVTDTVAAIATAPYSFYHFNRAALYGLPANILSVPIMGLMVMPAAIMALALMPVGWDGPFWRAAAAGVDIILWSGALVSSQPGAVATVALWPPAALGVLTLGALWFLLQRAPWRFAGLAALPIAAALIGAQRPPQIFVAAHGENAGIVMSRSDAAISEIDSDGAVAMFRPRRDSFSARIWKEYAGLDFMRASTLPMSAIGACDRAGCVVNVRGVIVAISNDPLGLADDCARADLVIAVYPVRRRGNACQAHLVQRGDVWDSGAHAIRIEPGGLHVTTVAEKRGRRPWSRE